MNLTALDQKIQAVAIGSGIAALNPMTDDEFTAVQAKWPDAAFVRRADNGAWRIDFAPEATNEQRTAAIAVAAAFDPSAPENQPSRRLSTYRIVRRLEAAGLLPAANALLDQNLAFKWRFTTAEDIAVDDPDIVAGLKTIGADPAVVLAPEE